MKKHLFGVALFTCLMAMGGIASAQTIDEIQVYTADGVPASPYDGQVVTVTGIIYERGQFSGGSHYILGDTGGLSMYQSGSPVSIGDLVTATGTVGQYGGEIQLGTVSFGLISSGNPVTPTPMTITEVLSTYENVGLFASVIGTVTEVDAPYNFYFTNGSDTLQVYIDSTTLIDLGAVEVGDVYQVDAPIVNYNTTLELKPRFQTDLVENPMGDTLPTISGVNCENWVPMEADPIVVNAVISDDSAVVSANLYYRDSDGEGNTSGWMSVPMSDLGGDNWTGMIAAPHAMNLVEFYLEATDDGAQTVTLPGDAPDSYSTCAVGITPIYVMQTVHPDSTDQTCPYNGKYLNIRGVVTAGTGQAGASSKFILQEQEKNPETNSYAFGGSLVYESSAMFEYYQGDVVEIGGIGNEYYGLSQILPHSGLSINLLDYGQDLPVPARVQTRVLDDNTMDDGNGYLGEAWESVWVKTFPSAIQDTVGFGAYNEYTVADKGVDSLKVAPVVELTYVPGTSDIITIESYMDFAFGEFRIVPISDEFIVQTGLTPADDTPTIVKAGGFKSIAPNPFNPATKIRFVVNRDNLVQLNVYNIRGEKVRTLVQENLPQSEYEFTWDGKNDAGQGVASGNYFARLRIGAEVMQVRKMSLIK